MNKKNRITEWIFEVIKPNVTVILLVISIIATIHLDNTYSKVLQNYEDIKKLREENIELEKEIAVRFEQDIKMLKTAVDVHTKSLDKDTAVYEELIQLLRQMTQD